MIGVNMMDLIDRAALKQAFGFSNDCRTCHIAESKRCTQQLFGVFSVCTMLDDAPKVEAVPLEPLCEWLENNALITSGAKANALFWKGIVLATGLLKEDDHERTE